MNRHKHSVQMEINIYFHSIHLEYWCRHFWKDFEAHRWNQQFKHFWLMIVFTFTQILVTIVNSRFYFFTIFFVFFFLLDAFVSLNALVIIENRHPVIFATGKFITFDAKETQISTIKINHQQSRKCKILKLFQKLHHFLDVLLSMCSIILYN